MKKRVISAILIVLVFIPFLLIGELPFAIFMSVLAALGIYELIKVREKFIIKTNITVMDDGYYIFEIIPKKENYAMRLFLDNNKKPLEYYFDITKNNGLYENTNIPCYDDLYLDITYLDGKINILDEDELIEAYNNKDITKEDLNLVYKTKEKLLKEIKSNANKLMNIDYTKYISNF